MVEEKITIFRTGIEEDKRLAAAAAAATAQYLTLSL